MKRDLPWPVRPLMGKMPMLRIGYVFRGTGILPVFEAQDAHATIWLNEDMGKMPMLRRT